ncbi:MAG: metal-dependent hydrolase, partial [Anaerolineales bacterium]|nr:metal-dependent hydrolase [Anaerolineales bacterium]
MSVSVTFHGHSTFSIDVNGTKLLIDPFFTGNPMAKISADDVNPDYILLTHGHGDHVGDTIAIAKRTGATVIANFEIVGWLGNQGVEKAHPQHLGGGFHHPFGHVKFTVAHHGSGLPDGSYGGNPAGFLLTLDGKKI